jgi:hypothetical protein
MPGGAPVRDGRLTLVRYEAQDVVLAANDEAACSHHGCMLRPTKSWLLSVIHRTQRLLPER